MTMDNYTKNTLTFNSFINVYETGIKLLTHTLTKDREKNNSSYYTIENTEELSLVTELSEQNSEPK